MWGHGLTSSMAAEDDGPLLDWPAALPAGWEVVRYDAPGHGRSPGGLRSEEYRWPALAERQLGLLDELGVEQAVLGGASMGAATALWSCVAAPSRVDGLVLVIPPTAWSTRPAQVRTYKAGAKVLAVPGGERVFARAARLAPPPQVLRSVELAPIHRAMADHAGDIERRRLAAILRGAAASDLPPVDDVVAAVGDTPVLVLAWATDAGHPVSTAVALGRALPHAEVHVAESAADVLAWSGLVRDFLARV